MTRNVTVVALSNSFDRKNRPAVSQWCVSDVYNRERPAGEISLSHPIEIPSPIAGTQPGSAVFPPPSEKPRTRRTQLWKSSIGLVEDLTSSIVLRNGSPEAFSPFFQVCLPYRGLFVWHVGHDEVVADSNQVLFVDRLDVADGAGRSIFLDGVIRLSPVGHQLLGHALAESLLASGLV